MKFKIAWRRKNTTYLHFGPKLFEIKAEAEELAEGLTLEHPAFDHGVQECDDEGRHVGNVTFMVDAPEPTLQETRLTEVAPKADETVSPDGVILDPQERLQEAPQEPNDTCPEPIDTEPSSPSCDP